MTAFNTVSFKTKTLIDPKKGPGSNLPVWPIAVDIGYSGVKMMCANQIACFPSYVIENTGTSIDDKIIGSLSKTAIAYRGSDGREFWVGQMAVDSLTQTGKESDLNSTMYVRDRYSQESYHILAEVGIAMALQDNQYGNPGGKDIFVQTGLPPKYLTEDAPYIKEAFVGEHNFELRFGKNTEWKKYNFVIKENNITVMSQPMGTLFSVVFDNNGGPSTYAQKILQSDSLIFDPGFGTLDIFHVRGGVIADEPLTRNELGMRAVLQRCGEIIKENRNLPKAVTIDQIQASLSTGIIKGADPAAVRRHMPADVEFTKELEDANREICNKAMQLLDEKYNYMSTTDYLVVTGGTGCAWENQIRNYFGNLTSLKILLGNVNDQSLPGIFSNVRGYYMSLLSSLKRN